MTIDYAFSNNHLGLPSLIYIGANPIVCIFLGVSAEANNPTTDIPFWEYLTRCDLILGMGGGRVGLCGEVSLTLALAILP